MTNVGFERVADPPGLEIRDRVSKRQFTLHTSSVPEPEPASTEPFPFPVELACRFVTESVRVLEAGTVNVRGHDGEVVLEPDLDARERLPKGKYTVEFHSRVKGYMLVEGALELRTEAGRAHVSFDRPTTVVVGARAHLRRPPTTVMTTRDVDDLRAAIETFSSSLQTTSPERSYPTLRGHPPRLEFGDELSIPASVEPPDTGITVIVRRDLSELFAVAPLAYYLGAAIEFGDRTSLRTAERPEFDLEAIGIERALKHVFLLDCLVRTHGLYRRKHAEYEALDPELPFDLAALYETTPSARLDAYLSVDPAVTEPHVPRWPSVGYVEPVAERVTALPYLVDDLALVRTDGVEQHQGPAARKLALSRFVTDTEPTRGASAVFDGRETFVDVPTTAVQHQMWVGEGIPLNAHKFVAAGCEHQFDREPTDDRALRATVVCNDESMAVEATSVEARYQPHPGQPFEVDVYQGVTTERLAALLRENVDFFHYIGHATEAGLECPDGYLDPASLPMVAVDSFMLNACQSYQHGVSMVEQGSVGGIVTIGDVPNGTAIETGVQVARLLDNGFSLGNALAVARRISVVGGQYTLVGTGRITLKRTDNVNMHTVRVEPAADGYRVSTDLFLDELWRLGSQSDLRVPDGWHLHLAGGEVGPFHISAEPLLDYLDLLECPVWLDGEFYWSSDVTRDLLES